MEIVAFFPICEVLNVDFSQVKAKTVRDNTGNPTMINRCIGRNYNKQHQKVSRPNVASSNSDPDLSRRQ